MLSRVVREEKAQQWLERLRAWQSQGDAVSLAQFARNQGWKDFDAYRWLRILRRQGRWPAREQGVASPAHGLKSTRAVKFVRVKLATPAPIAVLPLTLRVQLANGRSGEVRLAGVEQLLQVITALEAAA